MRSESQRLEREEMDVRELIARLWNQKMLIALVAMVVTVLAALYAFLASPLYEAKLFNEPPSRNDVAALNYGRGGGSGLSQIGPNDVYTVYLRHLHSEALRRDFFREYYLPMVSSGNTEGSIDRLYREFNQVLRVVPVQGRENRFYIICQLSDPLQAVDWVTRYVDMAVERAKSEILKGAHGEAQAKADSIERDIASQRETVQMLRKDRIAQLTEALRVARSVSLDNPPIISNNLSSEMDGSLMYMRGAKALEAELTNLRERGSDDPFIANLREKQESLKFYRNLSVLPESFDVYWQDGVAESPDAPLKPRKAMIIAFGVMVGVLLGVAMALVRIGRRH